MFTVALSYPAPNQIIAPNTAGIQMLRTTTLDMINQLVSFDTTSRESNLALIEFIQNYLTKSGVKSFLVYNNEKTKANLYATIGDQNQAGIMLSGHTDVVPVDGQNWTSDPFTIREADNRLYGRGTSDMKGFIAICLAMVPEFVARNLKMPIHLAFSYDEEVGCIGVQRLIDKINSMPIKPAMCIVGEPTDMSVIIGHKGKRIFTAYVRGIEIHSSLAPQAVNAIDYAAELITFIRKTARQLEKDGPFDALYDVQHSTVHTGVIQGGSALNIVPKDCTFEFEMRCIGKDDPDELEQKIRNYASNTLEPMMKAISPECGIEIICEGDVPGLDLDPTEEVVTFVKTLAERNDHAKVAFGTEAGLFQHVAHIPTVVCGPGSINQAHKPDEFISLEQLRKCEIFMERMLTRIS